MRNQIDWDCIRWEDGEVLVCKSLRRDGYSSGQHSWATTKKREGLDRSSAGGVETAQGEMELLEIYDPYGLVFVAPPATATSTTILWVVAVIATLGGLRLYAQRHSFLSHALAMGNSPADW